MSSDRRQPYLEDPSVPVVEDILELVASHAVGTPARRYGRLLASHAVWLCACETSHASPCWLIYAVHDDCIGWQRLPAGATVEGVIEAEHLTGGHPSPDGVLGWLRGDQSDPWWGGGDYPEDAHVYQEIRRRIVR